MKWEELDAILKNEKYYRNIINVHFNESASIDDLGVQNNSYGNSKERALVKKIEDKRYKRALQIVKAIDDFMESASELKIMIFEYKYRQRLYVSQIAWRTHYGTTKIKKEIREIRHYFKERLQRPKRPL
ncbi:hypothetical protein IR145_09715 [Streptococcus danieliae]|nr:hypothetical protein [Gemella sp. 19428wG2_WT2a]MBF0847727.1 hypothetical protein [Streptococcus danieliae]TFU57694.1 hypothetical protein E4T67_06465 [Gemella sp. WT2a]